jgi:hypothetical protein
MNSSNDITVAKTGQVMVAYADGCLGPALDPKANCITSSLVSANTYANHGAIARQVSGRGLFAKYDPKSTRTSNGRSGSGGAIGAGSGSGSLAATGSSPLLPVTGGLLGAAGLLLLMLLRRRAS